MEEAAGVGLNWSVATRGEGGEGFQFKWSFGYTTEKRGSPSVDTCWNSFATPSTYVVYETKKTFDF